MLKTVPPPRSPIRGPLRKSRAYDRVRDLPALLPVWPTEVDDTSAPGRLALLAKLRRALRQERKLGAGGHWTYDLARHAALRSAYRAEVAAALEQAPLKSDTSN